MAALSQNREIGSLSLDSNSYSHDALWRDNAASPTRQIERSPAWSAVTASNDTRSEQLAEDASWHISAAPTDADGTGSWISCVTEDADQPVFYYNTRTGVSQWEAPTEFALTSPTPSRSPNRSPSTPTPTARAAQYGTVAGAHAAVYGYGPALLTTTPYSYTEVSSLLSPPPTAGSSYSVAATPPHMGYVSDVSEDFGADSWDLLGTRFAVTPAPSEGMRTRSPSPAPNFHNSARMGIRLATPQRSASRGSHSSSGSGRHASADRRISSSSSSDAPDVNSDLSLSPVPSVTDSTVTPAAVTVHEPHAQYDYSAEWAAYAGSDDAWTDPATGSTYATSSNSATNDTTYRSSSQQQQQQHESAQEQQINSTPEAAADAVSDAGYYSPQAEHATAAAAIDTGSADVSDAQQHSAAADSTDAAAEQQVWSSTVDDVSGHVYYVNAMTGATQWEPPETIEVVATDQLPVDDLARLQTSTGELVPNSDANSSVNAIADATETGGTVAESAAIVDERTEAAVTHDSDAVLTAQYTSDDDVSTAVHAPTELDYIVVEQQHQQQQLELFLSQQQSQQQHEQSQQQQQLQQWTATVDDATGHTYYVNSTTGESQWERPSQLTVAAHVDQQHLQHEHSASNNVAPAHAIASAAFGAEHQKQQQPPLQNGADSYVSDDMSSAWQHTVDHQQQADTTTTANDDTVAAAAAVVVEEADSTSNTTTEEQQRAFSQHMAVWNRFFENALTRTLKQQEANKGSSNSSSTSGSQSARQQQQQQRLRKSPIKQQRRHLKRSSGSDTAAASIQLAESAAVVMNGGDAPSETAAVSTPPPLRVNLGQRWKGDKYAAAAHTSSSSATTSNSVRGGSGANSSSDSERQQHYAAAQRSRGLSSDAPRTSWAKPLRSAVYSDVLQRALAPAADATAKSTALFAAVLAQSRGDVEALLLQGVPPGCIDEAGRTPLHHACHRGDAPMVELLCDFGADADARESGGDTPLAVAAARGAGSCVLYLLESAAEANCVNAAGDTPLHLAVWHANLPCARALVEYGAAVDMLNSAGLTPAAQAQTLSPLRYSAPGELQRALDYMDMQSSGGSGGEFRHSRKRYAAAAAAAQQQQQQQQHNGNGHHLIGGTSSSTSSSTRQRDRSDAPTPLDDGGYSSGGGAGGVMSYTSSLSSSQTTPVDYSNSATVHNSSSSSSRTGLTAQSKRRAPAASKLGELVESRNSSSSGSARRHQQHHSAGSDSSSGRRERRRQHSGSSSSSKHHNHNGSRGTGLSALESVTPPPKHLPIPPLHSSEQHSSPRPLTAPENSLRRHRHGGSSSSSRCRSSNSSSDRNHQQQPQQQQQRDSRHRSSTRTAASEHRSIGSSGSSGVVSDNFFADLNQQQQQRASNAWGAPQVSYTTGSNSSSGRALGGNYGGTGDAPPVHARSRSGSASSNNSSSSVWQLGKALVGSLFGRQRATDAAAGAAEDGYNSSDAEDSPQRRRASSSAARPPTDAELQASLGLSDVSPMPSPGAPRHSSVSTSGSGSRQRLQAPRDVLQAMLVQQQQQQQQGTVSAIPQQQQDSSSRGHSSGASHLMMPSPDVQAALEHARASRSSGTSGGQHSRTGSYSSSASAQTTGSGSVTPQRDSGAKRFSTDGGGSPMATINFSNFSLGDNCPITVQSRYPDLFEHSRSES
jgi:Ankyrin repeats (3 copies)/WW domain/Ankyrin repeat